MATNLTNIISAIIIFQSVLFAFVLFTHKGQKLNSNLILASFLLVIACQFSLILSEEIGINQQDNMPFVCVFGFTYGPLLYLYTNSLIIDYFKFKSSYFVHFTPSIIVLLSAFSENPLCLKIGSLLYISICIYVFLAIRKLIDYRKIVMETQSSIFQTNLKWLQWTMIIFSLTLFLDIIDQFIFSLYLPFGVSVTHLTLLFLVNWMFYKGLKQPQIFLGVSETDRLIARESKIVHTKIDSKAKIELEHISKYLEDNKSFTNADISLNALAIELAISPRRLSYLINNYFNQNFMGFINLHRIELAKKHFINSSDTKETIMEVMYAVGFNSKSSFNTLFKQNTGLTPSEYKRQHYN